MISFSFSILSVRNMFLYAASNMIPPLCAAGSHGIPLLLRIAALYGIRDYLANIKARDASFLI